MPGVDEAHIDGAFGAGLLHAEREGIAKTQLFRDGESCHIAQFGVAIHLGA